MRARMSSSPLLEKLTITVTRAALLELRRRARARRLQPEDVAGEIVDLDARRSSSLPARFRDAAAEVDRRMRQAEVAGDPYDLTSGRKGFPALDPRRT